MSAPLFLGNDPRKMTEEEKSIIMNKMAIAIDQDPTEQGKRVKKDGDIEVWVKQLKNMQKSILILNLNNKDIKDFKLNITELGINKKGRDITDVYSGKKISPKKEVISFKMNPNACIFLKVE
jgi:alpha-galactosidase